MRVGDVPITIRQVRYLLEAIETKLAWTEERSPELSDADRAERRAALQNVMDKLLGATVAPHLPAHGRYAVDASAIESAARGKHRPTGPKSEVDSAVALIESLIAGGRPRRRSGVRPRVLLRGCRALGRPATGPGYRQVLDLHQNDYG